MRGVHEPVITDTEAGNRFLAAAAIAIVVAICSSIYVGEQGLKDNQHVGPVPANVTMAKPDLYLVKEGAVAPDTICLDGSSQDGPVDQTVNLPGLPYTLVECLNDQEWNVPNVPAKSFAPDGFVETATAPWYWVLLGALVILFTPWGYFRAMRRWRGIRNRLNEAEAGRLQATKELLVAQWAKSGSLDLDDPGYISDKDFEQRMSELEAKSVTA